MNKNKLIFVFSFLGACFSSQLFGSEGSSSVETADAIDEEFLEVFPASDLNRMFESALSSERAERWQEATTLYGVILRHSTPEMIAHRRALDGLLRVTDATVNHASRFVGDDMSTSSSIADTSDSGDDARVVDISDLPLADSNDPED